MFGVSKQWGLQGQDQGTLGEGVPGRENGPGRKNSSLALIDTALPAHRHAVVLHAAVGFHAIAPSFA